MSSRCDVCVADKSQCEQCCENPIYANVPTHSLFQAYIPTCPRGRLVCISDPAYIRCNDPEWYATLFGDKTPEEAAKTNRCHETCEYDPDEEYYCYDDEDK